MHRRAHFPGDWDIILDLSERGTLWQFLPMFLARKQQQHIVMSEEAGKTKIDNGSIINKNQ